jgi:hypothetical protein
MCTLSYLYLRDKEDENDVRYYIRPIYKKLVTESDNKQSLLSGNMNVKDYANLKRKAKSSSPYFSALFIMWNYDP